MSVLLLFFSNSQTINAANNLANTNTNGREFILKGYFVKKFKATTVVIADDNHAKSCMRLNGIEIVLNAK